ncbi:MAG: hypothetical protein HY360_00645, partial [Verrucomicrobia bacterium]|nr:hypothetical protein [Verrucomicrobiota bacterium]
MVQRFQVHGSRVGESGQTLIYLMSVLMVLTLMGLWLFDYNTAATSRIRAQNAADGSALAAAQWQARSLNAIGEINLIKAINTLLENVPPGPELEAQLTGAPPSQQYAVIQSGLDSLQARIGFVGPILAMEAAQQAAKNNGVPNNTVFTSAMQQHADLVATVYQDNFTAPSWGAGSWAESYAKMLHFLGDEGIAAAADNASYYGGSISASAQAQILLSKAFYRAIAIQNWCFLEDLLYVYQDYTYWGEITPLPQSVTGSEFFNLGVKFASSDSLIATATGLSDIQFQQLRAYFLQELGERNLPLHTDWPQFVPSINWAVYSPSSWTNWSKAHYYAASVVAEPRAVYDYSGCDAVTAVSIRNSMALALTNRGPNWTSWIVGGANQAAAAASVSRLEGFQGSSDLDVKANAAAKPFGKLPGINEPAYTFRVVLPVFTEVRLMPVAFASGYGNSDPNWLIHKLEHLPYNGPGDTVAYTHFGPDSLPDDCFYCAQLKKWEDPAFRQQGLDWLAATDPLTGALLHDCHPPPPPSPIGGGGGGGGGG